MNYRLQRHPIRMRTRFGHSLVVAYALPPAVLTPLLAPGLALDTYTAPDGREYGFVAVAVVATHHLRPAPLPARCGIDAVLTGYRVLARFRTPGGRTMRGLRILRSDTDRALVRRAGNALTHYRYHPARIRLTATDGAVEVAVDSADGAADLRLTARIDRPGDLPAGSPFATPADARRFAGPLPYTFDHEPQTGSIVVIKAERSAWRPTPVTVTGPLPGYLTRGAFAGTDPVLANAFHVADLDYGWLRGRRHAPDGGAR